MQYAFGAGNMYVTQLQDARGNSISNPTPYPLMALQEGSLSFSGDIKELYGQNQFAVAVGRGKMKLEANVKPARIFAAVWNSIFFGQTLSAGLLGNYTDTTGFAVPNTIGVTGATSTGGTGFQVGDILQASTGTVSSGGAKATLMVTAVTSGNPTGIQVLTPGSYTVAPTASASNFTNIGNAFTGVAGSGTGATLTFTTGTGTVAASPPVNGTQAAPAFNVFAADLGCIYASTGMPLKRVASNPSAGQYAVNTTTGVYTFASGDAGAVVLISYQYSTGSGFAANSTASMQTVQNLPMGYAPTFKADLTVSYLGKLTTFSFPMAIATKMDLGFKNEDFAVPQFAFQAFDPGNGNVMSWSTSE
jgi:hypothetical protein